MAEIDIKKVLAVLEGLRLGDDADGCWCEMAIDNPMYCDHDEACDAAQRLYSKLKRKLHNG